MRGLKRNLYYWLSTLHKQMLGIVAYIIAFVCFTGFASGGDVKENIMEILPNYLVMLVILIPVMSAMDGSSRFLPVSISFGTTRKASYTAMQLIQHLIMGEFLLISIVLFYWGKPAIMETIQNYILVVIGAVCVMIALGNIISIVNFKFGKTAGIITFFLIVFGIMFGIMGLVIIEDSSAVEPILNFLTGKQYLGFIGVALDLATVYGYYKVILKSNLQFV